VSRPIVRSLVMGALVVTMGSQADAGPKLAVVEIRSYNLKPGTRDRFQQLFLTDALPMLRRWKIDVVGYGPSLHDQDSYYLMRSFPSLEGRERTEDAFYASAEWRQGPREAILACIESYTTVVIRMDEAALRPLRRSAEPAPASR
jgi:hypothetical protein